jgi:hypothetical protein
LNSLAQTVVGRDNLMGFYTSTYCISLCLLHLHPIILVLACIYSAPKHPFSLICFTLFSDIGYYTNKLLPYSFARVGRLPCSPSVCSALGILGITTISLFLL